MKTRKDNILLRLPAEINPTNTEEAEAMKLVAERMRLSTKEPQTTFSSEIADNLEKRANQYLTLDELPEKGLGGEFVQRNSKKPAIYCPPVQSATRVNTEASLERLELVHDNGVLNIALDVAQAVGARNSAEQMLAHQMATLHRTAMDLISEAGNIRDSTEKTRLINAAARLMDIYQKSLLTLNRLHSGGQQVVTVQHVQVSGGQAVINGSVQTGGMFERKTEGK